MDLFEKAAKKREERVRDIFLDLPLPTWDGDLVVRFVVVDRDYIDKFAAADKRTPEMDMDFVITATSRIYMHDPDGAAEGDDVEYMVNADGTTNEEYILLKNDAGTPVKFDQTMAEMLGQDQLRKARDVLSYCVKGNMIAIGGLAGKLVNWMQDTDTKVAGSIVGGSSTPTP